MLYISLHKGTMKWSCLKGMSNESFAEGDFVVGAVLVFFFPSISHCHDSFPNDFFFFFLNLILSLNFS